MLKFEKLLKSKQEYPHTSPAPGISTSTLCAVLHIFSAHEGKDIYKIRGDTTIDPILDRKNFALF